MSRIAIQTAEQSPAASLPLLDAVNKQLGVIPNLMKMVGNSPAALEGYLSLNGAVGKGVLPMPMRELLALATAEFNGCDYCLSAHSYLGKNLAKLSETEMHQARDFHSIDPATNAALHFARRVLAERGHVSDADVAAIRAAGFGDAGIVEIVTNVALNVLTNYLNNVAATDIDFPLVSAQAKA
ncbi:MAG: carboxymuconolactone decarboxylase family protein [Pseudomonadota bacterium]